jgi:TolB-like protein
MKLSIVAAALMLIAATVSPQEKKTTVAVLEFQTSGGLEKSEVSALSNRFRGILVKTNAFEVVEREKMNEVLKAQDFNISDACNTAECAVQVGQLLGVETMIAGDLGKIGDTYTIDLRLISVQTGKILQTQTQDYQGKVDGLLGVMQTMANAIAGIRETRATVKKFNLSITSILPKKAKTMDVNIMIDGKQAGLNKVTVSLDEGKHKVLVTTGSTDFTEFKGDIDLRNDQTITARLEYSDSYAQRMAAETARAKAAQELAAKQKAEKEKAEREKAAAINGGSKPGSKKIWYIIGGAAVIGGGAAVLLSGSKSGGAKDLKIYNPQLPPNP